MPSSPFGPYSFDFGGDTPLGTFTSLSKSSPPTATPFASLGSPQQSAPSRDPILDRLDALAPKAPPFPSSTSTTTRPPRKRRRTLADDIDDALAEDQPDDLSDLTRQIEAALKETEEPKKRYTSPFELGATSLPALEKPSVGPTKPGLYQSPFDLGRTPATSRPPEPFALPTQKPTTGPLAGPTIAPPTSAPSRAQLIGKAQPLTTPKAADPFETQFQTWYAKQAQQHGLNPDPDAPDQFYDYRAAFKAGATPDAKGHWPSQFKEPGHPNEIVGGFNTRTGERVPGTKRGSEEELVKGGWSKADAHRLAQTPEPSMGPWKLGHEDAAMAAQVGARVDGMTTAFKALSTQYNEQKKTIDPALKAHNSEIAAINTEGTAIDEATKTFDAHLRTWTNAGKPEFLYQNLVKEQDDLNARIRANQARIATAMAKAPDLAAHNALGQQIQTLQQHINTEIAEGRNAIKTIQAEQAAQKKSAKDQSQFAKEHGLDDVGPKGVLDRLGYQAKGLNPTPTPAEQRLDQANVVAKDIKNPVDRLAAGAGISIARYATMASDAVKKEWNDHPDKLAWFLQAISGSGQAAPPPAEPAQAPTKKGGPRPLLPPDAKFTAGVPEPASLGQLAARVVATPGDPRLTALEMVGETRPTNTLSVADFAKLVAASPDPLTTSRMFSAWLMSGVPKARVEKAVEAFNTGMQGLDDAREFKLPVGMQHAIADTAISFVNGAIGLPEAAVGGLDIVYGPEVGKFAEEKLGFRPAEARQILKGLYSQSQLDAIARVNKSTGFVDKAITSLMPENWSVPIQSAVESAPGMMAMGATGRALMAIGITPATLGGEIAAGALSEGGQQWLQFQEALRQQYGTPTPEQEFYGLASGAGDAAIVALSGRVADRLGINDVDTMLVAAAANPKARAGLVKQVIYGAVNEGVLQELPQSIQEQVLQNLADKKPWWDGVDDAAVMGMLTGAMMGAGPNAVAALTEHHPPQVSGIGSTPQLTYDRAPEPGPESYGVEPAPPGYVAPVIPGREQLSSRPIPGGFVPPTLAEPGAGPAVGEPPPIEPPPGPPGEPLPGMPPGMPPGVPPGEPITPTGEEPIAPTGEEPPVAPPGAPPSEVAPPVTRLPDGTYVRSDEVPLTELPPIAPPGEPPAPVTPGQPVPPVAPAGGVAAPAVPTRVSPEDLAAAIAQALAEEDAADAAATGTAAAPTTPAQTGVPFTITRAMRADLEGRGYTTPQIDAMKPAEAHAILAQPVAAAPPTGAAPAEPRWKAGVPADVSLHDPDVAVAEAKRVQVERRVAIARANQELQDTPTDSPAYQRLADRVKRAIDNYEGTWKWIDQHMEGVDTHALDGEVEAAAAQTLKREAERQQEHEANAGRPRRNAIGSYALEDALSPGGQQALGEMFKEYTSSRDLRHIREAMEIYQRLLDMETPAATKVAKTLRDATDAFFAHDGPANAISEAAYKGLQTITGEKDPDWYGGALLENEVFASAKDAGDLIFSTLNEKTGEFDVQEFNTAFGEVEFRRDPHETFPAPKESVNLWKGRQTDNYRDGKPVLSQEAGRQRIEEWKAKARAIGEANRAQNERKIVISLYDRTGIVSQPWADAGYSVRRFDIRSVEDGGTAEDLTEFGNWMGEIEDMLAEGYQIVGILAQPPCTSFTLSGAQHWPSKHDAPNHEWLVRTYGARAAEHFNTPTEYANTLVAVVKLMVAQANPRFYVLENPTGRIDKLNGLPEETLKFNPDDYGEPFTKATRLWGEFNPDLPTAQVGGKKSEGGEGSRAWNLSSAQRDERAQTPEGFAYAFFIANEPLAREDWQNQERPAQQEPEGPYQAPVFTEPTYQAEEEPAPAEEPVQPISRPAVSRPIKKEEAHAAEVRKEPESDQPEHPGDGEGGPPAEAGGGGGVVERPEAPKPQEIKTTWMNEASIEQAVERFKDHPVLGPAARFLEAFKDEVNRVSDGWPYWSQPSKAAGKLQGLLNGHLMAGMGAYPRLPAPTAADVLATMPPIKAFMTKRGTAAGIKLPALDLPSAVTPAGERATRADGRLVPVVGDKVYQRVRGFGGGPAQINGEVYAGPKGVPRVRITGSATLIGQGPAQGKTYQLDESWTVTNDPEIARRQAARDAREAQVKQDAETEQAAFATAKTEEAATAIAAGRKPLTADTPVGARVFNHWQNEWATVDSQSEFGPALRAETGGTDYTIGNSGVDGTWAGFSVEPPAEPSPAVQTWGHAAVMSPGAASAWFANVIDESGPVRVRHATLGEGYAIREGDTNGFVTVTFDKDGRTMGVPASSVEPAWKNGKLVTRPTERPVGDAIAETREQLRRTGAATYNGISTKLFRATPDADYRVEVVRDGVREMLDGHYAKEGNAINAALATMFGDAWNTWWAVNKPHPQVEEAAPAAETDPERIARLEAEADVLIKQITEKLNRISVNAPLNPEILLLISRLALNYIERGIVHFRQAAVRFRRDFSETPAGDRHFSMAWSVAQELQSGKTLPEAVKAAKNQRETRQTVADGLREAQEAGEYTSPEQGGPDVGPRDRPGPAPKPGRGAADTVRDGGEGPLGAVPPDTGEGAGAARSEGARPSDTEGRPPTGVSDQPDAGTEPGTPPGSGAGTVQAGGVPAAGGIKGTRPADYQLTPERIAGIINRGNVQRLADNVAAIRIVTDLQGEGRYPTVDEQEALAKYVGWGATDIQQYLEDRPRYDWSANEKALWEELRSLTTPEQRSYFKRSSPNAHFTYGLYQPIWNALEWMGFTGGRVLEPSVGTGHALGFMPPAIRQGSTISASELEPLTAAMAGFLYPSAKVQPVGYEKIRLPRNTQDLVISNVPFGRFGTSDKLFSGSLKFLTEKIHSYFFAKGMEHLRPGGYMVFITSRYTMDGPEHMDIRRYLMNKGHFVGAVRLPGGDKGAFVASAKTQVVTDVIVLQKFNEGEQEARNKDLFIRTDKLEEFSTPAGKDSRGRKREARNVYRSSWYTEHPQFILGTEEMTGSQYSSNEYTVQAKPDENLQEALETALKVVLPKDSYAPASTASTNSEAPQVIEGDFKPGELRVGPKNSIQRALLDGTVVDATPRKKDGTVDVPKVQRTIALIGVRDARRAVVAAMRSTTATDRGIKTLRAGLQKSYDAFQKRYGDLNALANRLAFASDPEAASVLGLEVLEARATPYTDKAGKQKLRVRYEVKGLADIFKKRTINAPPTVEHVDTPKDALLASMGMRTKIDWPFMAGITGDGTTTPARIAELQQSLKQDGYVFEQPDGSWAVKDEYLSGDVVTKLADAAAAADEDPARFKGNVEALQKIQPAPKTVEDVAAGRVSIALGVHWADPADFAQFVNDSVGQRSGTSMRLDGTQQYVRWTTAYENNILIAGNRHPLAVKYGRDLKRVYGFTELLDDALNLKQPDLFYTEEDADGTKRRVKQEEQTLAAKANVEELRNLWSSWINTHPEAMARVLETYNHRYNRTVTRQYDGAHLANFVDPKTGAPMHPFIDPKDGTPLPEEKGGKASGAVRSASLPGLALPFALFPHQLRAIWRVLSSGNTLLAHEVGAGKTFEMIATAMEMRRTGRARKPLVTVPTYLLGSWRKDIMKAYPNVKLLAFDEKDLASDRRQQAMARIAHGDWDIVLVPHSSFELLKVSSKRMEATLQEWVDEISAAEADARAERGENDPSVKQLAAARARVEDKIAKLLEKADKGQDNALNWEDLGVDALLVDEAHSFKNLYFFSKLDNIRGLSKSNADKSLDMFIKVKDINEASNYRNLVFATATPVMNSLAEVYTMQRYLQPQRLVELGFENFDNWYATFAQASPVVEQQPDGSYKEVMRVAQFRNGRLLYRIASEVMDYVGWHDMPYLKTPKLRNNDVTLVQNEPHPMYDLIQTWFTERLAALRARPPYYDKNRREYIAPDRFHPVTGEPLGKKDNILAVMGDAKLAAIDARLVLGDHAQDFSGSRLQSAAKIVADFHKREAKNKGVALMFLDVGTPTSTGPLEFLRGVEVEDETGGGSLGVEDDPLSLEDEDAAALATADSATNFNMYEAIKKALIARGVPSHEIAFIHQARNAAERLALFQAAQEGTIRVLLASTDKGGLGMNIQDRLGMIVEVDAPRAMRPGDIRQRHGRGIRQGNMYDTIDIVRFVTKGSTDEWLYGLLGKKQGMITDFMRGELDEFIDDGMPRSLEEAEARATNDPRKVELLDLKGRMARMEAQAAAAERAMGDATAEANQQRHVIPVFQKAHDLISAWLKAHHKKIIGDDFVVTIGDATITKRAEANAALIEALKPMAARAVQLETYTRHDEPWQKVGEVGGLPLIARATVNREANRQEVHVALDADALGEGEIEVTHLIAGKNGLVNPQFGEGRNVVASAVDRYNALPSREVVLRSQLASAQEKLDRAEKLLSQGSEAPAKAAAARARIAAIERELKTESDIKNAEATQEAREKQARRQHGAPSGEASVGGYATTAPSSATFTTRTINPVEFPELVDLVRGLLGMPPRVVKAFRGTLGTLGRFRGDRGIDLLASLFKQGNEAELAAVLAHEIGHLIDWLPDRVLKRGNILGRLQTLQSFLKQTYTAQDGTTIKNAEVRDELKKLSAFWRPWDRSQASDRMKEYRDSSKELYADALSAILVDSGTAQREAPIFFKEFWAELGKKPEVEQALNEVFARMSGTREEIIERRRKGVRGMMADADVAAVDRMKIGMRAREMTREKAGLWLESALAGAVDKHAPFLFRLHADRKAGIAITPADNPFYALSERVYRLGGSVKTWLQRFVDPLRKTLAAYHIDWVTLGEALMYERIVAGDRSSLANPRGLSVDAATELHRDLMKRLTMEQRRALVNGIDTFRAAVKEVARQAHAIGLFTDAQWDTIDKNPAYSTFQTVEHFEDSVTSRIYHQVGTLKDIINVADATTLKTVATIAAIEHQRAKVSGIQYLQKYHPGDIEQAKEVHGKGGRTIVLPSPDPKRQALVTYYEKGKLRGVYVDPVIAHSLNNETAGQTFMRLTGLEFANKYFRTVFTTLNVGFQTYNVIRDFLRFWKNTPDMSARRAIQRYWEAVPLARVRTYGLPEKPTASQLKAWNDLLSAQEKGILSITFNEHMRGEAVEDTLIENILAKADVGMWQKDRHPVLKILDAVEDVGNFIEALPKGAGIYEVKGKGSIDEIPPHLRQFVRAKIGSPDFLAGGYWKPITNNLFLFSNAIAQGWRSDLEVAFKRGPDPVSNSGFWWKTAGTVIVPKLLMMAAVMGLAPLGGDDEEDDNWIKRRLRGRYLARLMNRVTEYDLSQYTVVPLGEDDHGNTIYLKLPQDDTARFVGGMFWRVLRAASGDRDVVTALQQMVAYTDGQFPTFSPILGVLGSAGEYAMGLNPYDPFRNQFLLTPDEQKARGAHAVLDSDAFTKLMWWEFKQVGGDVLYKAQIGDMRPKEKTIGQLVIDLPVASNVVGRFVRITKAGEAEKAREAGARVEAFDAEVRTEVGEAVNDAVRMYQRLPSGQQSGAWLDQKAQEIADAVYPNEDDKEHEATVKRLEKRLRVSMVRGGDDFLSDLTTSNASNDVKVARIMRARKTMRRDKYEQWIQEAADQGIISDKLLEKIHDAEAVTPR